MRTNIDIDDQLMAEAMKAGPFTTKKDAVEAGLRLLARQAAYREVARWRGQLTWEGDESVDWAAANRAESAALSVQEPAARFAAAPAVKARRARR
jgi:Arc/MetJ family transcription regulator